MSGQMYGIHTFRCFAISFQSKHHMLEDIHRCLLEWFLLKIGRERIGFLFSCFFGSQD